ncbi:MAG TPA: DUF1802 family protein [Crinalium sp.]|jgi:hypothetical protein
MSTHALKEWAVAVDALLNGEAIALLRKGGIREEKGHFSVEHHRIWLYPTYEHQKPELLKSPYAQQVQLVPSGWHPEHVPVQGWADITHIFQLDSAAAVSALSPFHIWNEQFVAERFHWKPRQPLYVLLLRVYRLAIAQTIPYRSEYGGCKSWIDLNVDLESQLSASQPALTHDQYQQQVQNVQRVLAETALGQKAIER